MQTDPDIWRIIIWGFLHVIGVAAYVGGAIAMEFVLGPAQKAVPPAQAQVMGQKTADRFLWIAWGALFLILITGILRLEMVGRISWSWPFFEAGMSLSYGYGRTILALFILWCLLVINGAILTFVLRPRIAGKLTARTSAAQVSATQASRLQAATWAQRLTRVDLGVAVVAVLLGASLKWGGAL
jgi:uncharacterized membrane protein